jgi:hypothetical protein
MKSKNIKIEKILPLLIIIFVVLFGFAVFQKFNSAEKLPKGQLSDKQIEVIVKKVSKLINIPKEIPAIATIIKADKLIAEQSFYIGSKDGDYLIVFPQAQKAIIYRENEDKIINTGPIVIDQSATTTQSVVMETETVATSTSDKGTGEE